MHAITGPCLKVLSLSASTALLICHVAAAQDGPLAFTGAVIETMSDEGRVEGGVVVVEQGKIKAVGQDVRVPENARVIDARGMTIMPGVIDPYHAVSVGGGPAPRTTRTIIINGRAITVGSSRSTRSSSFTRIADEFYPFDTDFRPLVRTGITLLNLTARGHGQAALARNTPERRESMLIDGDGVLFATVTNATSSLEVVRRGLGITSGARSGSGRGSGAGQARAGGGSARSGSRGGGRSSGRSSTTVGREQWGEVREGKRRLIVNADNAAAILHLLELLKDHEDVKLTLVATGPNVHQNLDAIAARRQVSLILQPAIEYLPNSRVRMCSPAIVHQREIAFALSLSLNESEMRVSQDAPLLPVAFLVKSGLPRDAALAALTTRPAEILGIEKTHGSVQPDRSANLLFFDGDPLDPASQLKRVVVEGNTVHEN